MYKLSVVFASGYHVRKHSVVELRGVTSHYVFFNLFLANLLCNFFMIYYPKGDFFSTWTVFNCFLPTKQNAIGTLKALGSWPKTNFKLESLHTLCALESLTDLLVVIPAMHMGGVVHLLTSLQCPSSMPHLHLLKCQLSLKIQFKHYLLQNTLLWPLLRPFLFLQRTRGASGMLVITCFFLSFF